MSQINVNTIGARTGTEVAVNSGHYIHQAGIPIQVVTYQNNISASNTINSTSYTNITHDGSNRLEIKITPKKSTSKILLISNVNTYHEYAGYVANVRAYRDISGGSSGTLVQSYRFRDEDTPNNYNTNYPVSYNFVDTPNTTSEVTYYFQAKVENSSSDFAWVTYSSGDRGQSFFLWEIGV